MEVIRLILSGERVVYEGEIFKLDLGFRFEIERVREHIPIYLASLAPRAVAQTGEQADGWMPYYWPASRFGEGLALLAQGAQEAGRAWEEIAFAPAIAMTIGDDTGLAGTLDDVRQGLDALFERGVDLPILTLPPGSLEETERVLGTLVQG